MIIDDNLYKSMMKLTNYSGLFLFNQKGDFVEVFKRSTFKFIVPVGYFSNLSVPLQGLKFTYGNNYMNDKLNIKLPELYPLQRRVVEEVESQFQIRKKECRPLYVTLHLACGFGKTVTASYLVGLYKKNTVICVPSKIILKQWEAPIHSLGVSYYVSQEGVSKLLKILRTNFFSILVIVDKHLNNKEFCEYIYEKYDVFVLDESHIYNLMNESSMSKFLSYYPPKMCYFLTATPRLQNSIYCNAVINFIKFSSLQKVLYVIREYYTEYSNACIKSYVSQLRTAHNKYHLYTEKALAEDVYRNKTIINKIIEIIQSKKSKKILVITKLRSHMFYIYKELCLVLGNIVYVGDAQKRNSTSIISALKSMNEFVLISTLYYAGTGLDIPDLDGLFICNAVMNAMQSEQVIGRICRDTGTSNTKSIFLFINTSINDIKSILGTFVDRYVQQALRLGFREIT